MARYVMSAMLRPIVIPVRRPVSAVAHAVVEGVDPINACPVINRGRREREGTAVRFARQDDRNGDWANRRGSVKALDRDRPLDLAGRVRRLAAALVVRLEGTKVEEGKKLLGNSGLDVITADNLDDAAAKIVKAVGNKSTAPREKRPMN